MISSDGKRLVPRVDFDHAAVELPARSCSRNRSRVRFVLVAHRAGVFVRRNRPRGRQQQVEQPIFGVRAAFDRTSSSRSLAHHVDAQLHEVAHHRLDVAADVADFGELARFDLHERRLRQPRQPARDLRLADAGRPDHQDVFRRDFLGELRRKLLPPHPVAKRDRDRALRGRLADDVLVEFGDDLSRRERLGRGLRRFGKQNGHLSTILRPRSVGWYRCKSGPQSPSISPRWRARQDPYWPPAPSPPPARTARPIRWRQSHRRAR